MNDAPQQPETPHSGAPDEGRSMTHALQDRIGGLWVPTMAVRRGDRDVYNLAPLARGGVWPGLALHTIEQHYAPCIPICELGSDRVIRRNHFAWSKRTVDVMLRHLSCNRCRIFWRQASPWVESPPGPSNG